MWFRSILDALKPDDSGAPTWRGDPRRRSASCRLTVEPLGDRLVPATLSVGDAVVVEGHAGSQYAVVEVSLDARTNKTVSVDYATADGTAAAGRDYDAVAGRLTFAPGETRKSVRVPVRGDRLPEADETFSVNLSGARNVKIADGQGAVTVVNDEPRINVSSVSVLEGDSGTTPYTFTVSLSAAYDHAVTVNFATRDDTAVAGVDYLAAAGTLTFAAGETTKTVTVDILGDTMAEPDKGFYLDLSGVSANATLSNAAAYGVITDDDGYYDYAYYDYDYAYYGGYDSYGPDGRYTGYGA